MFLFKLLEIIRVVKFRLWKNLLISLFFFIDTEATKRSTAISQAWDRIACTPYTIQSIQNVFQMRKRFNVSPAYIQKGFLLDPILLYAGADNLTLDHSGKLNGK